MKSFKERMKMLEDVLSNTTPDELLKELQSYEAIGPLAKDFLEVDEEQVSTFVQDLYEDGKTPSEQFGITHEELITLEDLIFPDLQDRIKQTEELEGEVILKGDERFGGFNDEIK